MLEQKKWYDIVLDKDNKWQINLTTGQLFKIEANGARTLVSSVSPHFDVLSVNMIGVRFTWENNKIASVCNYIPHNVEEKNKVTIEYVINPTVTYTTITDVKTNLRKRYILYLTVNTYEEEFLDVNYASLKKLMIWHNNNNSVRTIDETTYNGGDISIFCQTKITVDTVTGDVQSQEVKTYKVEDNALVLTNAYTVDYAYTNDKLTKMQDSNAMVTDYTYKNNGDLELVKTYHIDDVGNQNQTYLQLISQLQDDNGLKIKKDKHDRVKRISIKIGGVLNPVTGKIEGGTCNINSFGYNARGFIKTLESCGTKFEYEYDGWGRVNQVKQNNQNYAEMEYIGDTIKTIYANNEVFEKTNNNYGQPVSVTKSVGNIDETILSYAYDNDQKLISVTDHIENKVINLEQLEIPDFVGETECDKLGRLKMFKVEFGGNEKMQHNIGYRVKEINGPGSGITTTNAVGQEDFIFVKNNTQLYEQTLYMYGNSFYDNKENITSITENDGVS
ncbi:MAG: hypothetical protein FWD32_02370, partial [Firmicutes bacterium]|nr:hypothetical protein [Bacillota bacterium]